MWRRNLPSNKLNMSRVAVLIGSLREGSYSRKIGKALAELAPDMIFEEVEIGGLSYFNEELEAAPPADWLALRGSIALADAVLFVTPEYVRSVPGVLKNAVDIGARPWRQGVLVGKPAAVISISVGALGGLGANHHLRQSLVSVDMPTLAQPEAYLGNVAAMFDVNGRLIDARTREFLTEFGRAFAAHIARNAVASDRAA